MRIALTLTPVRALTILGMSAALLTASPEARADSLSGQGLVSRSGDTLIDQLNPSQAVAGDRFRYYSRSADRHVIGTMTLGRVINGVLLGRFEDRSTDGQEGCSGRLEIRPVQADAYDLTWFVDGTLAGLNCPRVGRTFKLAEMGWGSLTRWVPDSTLWTLLDASIPAGVGGDVIPPGQAALLRASQLAAPINLRAGAGTTFAIRQIGYSGEFVQTLGSALGPDNHQWYQVRLMASGDTGWVREDLIQPIDF
jgi:hypothetical protein